MAITFPSSPSPGDIFTSNGKSWQYVNGKWESYGETVAPDVFAVDAANDVVNVYGSLSAGASASIGTDLEVSGDLTVDTNTLYVDSANNRVGIGTTTPGQALDVRGRIVANYTDNAFPLSVQSGQSTSGIILADAGTTSNVVLRSNGDDFQIRTNASDRVTVDSSGNVGIGTTSPEKPLHVVIGSKSGGSYGSTHYFLVDSDGDSGLGVYSGESSEGFIRFGDAANGAAGGFRYDHSVDELYIRSGGGDSMTFDSSGNIGINTAPSTNILSINGTANPGTNGDVYIGSSNIPLNLYTTTTSTSASGWKLYSNVTGTEVLQALVRANGDFESRTNSYGATSDAAIKQDIVDAPSQWDDIKAVQLRKYRLIDDVAENGDDAVVQLGVIAQELEAAGMGGLVVDSDPDDLDKPYKSVKYSVLLLKALGALQEAMARIEALEAE